MLHFAFAGRHGGIRRKRGDHPFPRAERTFDIGKQHTVAVNGMQIPRVAVVSDRLPDSEPVHRGKQFGQRAIVRALICAASVLAVDIHIK